MTREEESIVEAMKKGQISDKYAVMAAVDNCIRILRGRLDFKSPVSPEERTAAINRHALIFYRVNRTANLLRRKTHMVPGVFSGVMAACCMVMPEEAERFMDKLDPEAPMLRGDPALALSMLCDSAGHEGSLPWDGEGKRRYGQVLIKAFNAMCAGRSLHRLEWPVADEALEDLCCRDRLNAEAEALDRLVAEEAERGRKQEAVDTKPATQPAAEASVLAEAHVQAVDKAEMQPQPRRVRTPSLFDCCVPKEGNGWRFGFPPEQAGLLGRLCCFPVYGQGDGRGCWLAWDGGCAFFRLAVLLHALSPEGMQAFAVELSSAGFVFDFVRAADVLGFVSSCWGRRVAAAPEGVVPAAGIAFSHQGDLWSCSAKEQAA